MLKVNFKVLLEAWGIKLTTADIEEAKISVCRAFQVGRKYKMLKAIFKSSQIIPEDALKQVTDTVAVPDIETIAEKVGKTSDN